MCYRVENPSVNMKNNPKSISYNRSFTIGIVLNTIYVIIELFYGMSVRSSALIADAGHNASDVLCLVISWIAIFLASLKPFGKFTYGLRKTTILSSSINGILIVVAAVLILKEAIHKLQNPVELKENVVMIVAAIGIMVNAGTALLFTKGKKTDINIKGTYLHMAGDASVSAGVVAGGFIMKISGAYWIDPILSFLIVSVILWSAIGLLIDSFKLSVDAVPNNIDIEEVKSFLQKQNGVEDVHELHVWALSTTEIALTAHLVIPNGCDDSSLESIREKLRNEYNIEHSTIQIENCIVKEDEIAVSVHS